MTGGIGHVALAALAFVGAHFLVSSTPLRDRLVGALGERLYLGLYSIVSLLLFAWLLWAFANAPAEPLWIPAGWMRWVPILVMPLALLLLVGGYAQRNPTAVMQDQAGIAPTTGILAITRHPIMWAIGLWALAHMAANGDAASVVLFGALALLALGGTLAIDARKRRAWGKRWPAFIATTSNLPFAALFAGRSRLTLGGLGWWRLLLAAALYLALLLLHPYLFGAPVLPI